MFVAKLTAVLNAESGETAPSARGIERQQVLQALQRVHGEEAREVEEEGRDGIPRPRHLARRIDAGQAVGEALGPPEHRREEGALAREDAGHELAQGLGERDQHRDVERALQEEVGGHQKSSGRKSAQTR